MKVIVGVNTLESVSSFVYASHCKMWVEITRKFPKDEFLLYTPYRMSIDNMRNDVARIALEQDADYIFFIDDDVIVMPDVFSRLHQAGKDIIAGMTYVRGYPFHPMFFKDLGNMTLPNGIIRKNITFHDDYEKVTQENGLCPTAAVGFSCVLINVKTTLKKMSPPYFVTGPGHTEDVYFCLKASQELLNPTPEIWVDTLCKTGHLMMPDAVSSENVEILRKYYKPEVDTDDLIKFRMKDHIRLVQQQMLGGPANDIP